MTEQHDFSGNPADDEFEREWTLDERDVREVRRGARTDASRLTFAVQLCVLRTQGILVQDFSVIPPRVINFLASQLGQPPVLFLDAPKRVATDADQEKRVREYLGFVFFDDEHAASLEDYLRSLVVDETMSSEDLLARTYKFLLARKIIRPAEYRLDRIVATVATSAEESIFQRIARFVSSAQCDAIDQLLDPPEAGHTSFLAELKDPPPAPTPPIILRWLAKAKRVREIGVNIDGVDVRRETIGHFAARIRRSEAYEVRRIEPPVKRYAMMACFLSETEKTLLDSLVKMHHVYMTDIFRRAKRTNDSKQTRLRKRNGRELDTVLDTLTHVADSVEKIRSNKRLAKVMRALNIEDIRKAVESCNELRRLGKFGFVEQARARHHLVKQYLPEFLKLPFEGRTGSEPLVDAINFAREWHNGKRKNLDDSTPIGFATGVWKAAIETDEGEAPHAPTWELALAISLKERLRAGDIHLPRSGEHAPTSSLFYSDSRWKAEREEAYADLSISMDADRAIAELRDEYEEEAKAFEASLPQNPFASLRDGKLSLRRRKKKDVPPEVEPLKEAIVGHLQYIQIEDLLTEVDAVCGFSKAFVPIPGDSVRVDNPYPVLLAALIAHGTNIGMQSMAGCNGGHFSLDELQSVSDVLIRNETLKEANRRLVNCYDSLPLSSVWGPKSISSSDGRFREVQRSSLIAALQTRKYGYVSRAVNVITHQANFAVFGTRVVSCNAREALYVLDGLLENDTTLEPHEHTTDTHGYIDQLFGLCYLLGYSFVPRLAKLARHRVYKIDRNQNMGRLDAWVRHVADTALVHEQWDELARVAASLKNKTAPANVVVERLLASSPSDRRSKALTELGCIVKTMFIFRYLRDEMLRDRIQLALNRGESQHSLVAKIAYGNGGILTTANPIAMMHKASALSLLCNAIVVWNTVRMTEIVQQLERMQGPVSREHLAFITPIIRKHVIPNGSYRFDRAIRSSQIPVPADPLP